MTSPDPAQLSITDALPPTVHNPGLDTEHAAHQRAAATRRGLIDRIARFLESRAAVGATKHEVDAAFQLVDAQSSRALYDLRRMGKAVLLAEKRRAVTGGPEAHVCVLSPFVNGRALAEKQRV